MDLRKIFYFFENIETGKQVPSDYHRQPKKRVARDGTSRQGMARETGV